MSTVVPIDLLDRVMSGQNYRVEGVIECMWTGSNKLSVSSIKGGFTKLVLPGTKEKVQGILSRLIENINATSST